MKTLRNDKPLVGSEGYSDPVVAITENGLLLVAVWDSRDGLWHVVDSLDGNEEVVGHVADWHTLPKNWIYDSEYYTPVREGLGNEERTDDESQTHKDYKQSVNLAAVPSQWRTR